jgi:hypothetical protein
MPPDAEIPINAQQPLMAPPLAAPRLVRPPDGAAEPTPSTNGAGARPAAGPEPWEVHLANNTEALKALDRSLERYERAAVVCALVVALTAVGVVVIVKRGGSPDVGLGA